MIPAKNTPRHGGCHAFSSPSRVGHCHRTAEGRSVFRGRPNHQLARWPHSTLPFHPRPLSVIFVQCKYLDFSNLPIPPFKIRPFLQKKRGRTQEKRHFFLRFPCFLGFCALQAVAFQGQAAIQPLQKKSCLKTDGRFSVCSGMCHNRRMTVEMTGRNEGCEGCAAAKRRPALRAKRFGVRNDSSAFGHRFGEPRWRARSPRPVGLNGAGKISLIFLPPSFCLSTPGAGRTVEAHKTSRQPAPI
jgi:hypothetical protein